MEETSKSVGTTEKGRKPSVRAVLCTSSDMLCCDVLSCLVLSCFDLFCRKWLAHVFIITHHNVSLAVQPLKHILTMLTYTSSSIRFPSSLYPHPHHLSYSPSFSSTPKRYLFPGAESDPQDEPTEEIVTASGKMVVLDRLLSKLKKKGHRVVLFSQYTSTLDIIHDYLGK